MKQNTPTAGGRDRAARPAKSPAGWFVVGAAVVVVAGFFLWPGHAPAPTERTVAASATAPAPVTNVPPPAEPLPSVAPAPAPISTPATAPTPGPAERLAAAVALLTSPDIDPASAERAREMVDSTYAPLYRQLGLSADDASALGDLLMQRLDADRAGLAAIAAQGLTLADNPAEVALVVRAAVTPIEVKIRALLGAEGYPQYQAFAAPIRAAVAAALRNSSR